MSQFKFADRVTRVRPSLSIAASQRARDLQEQGIDVKSLTSGEPDFATPAHIIAAAKEAMDRGETKYTTNSGTTELKKAVIAKFKRDNNLTYEMDEVLAATGAKQVLFNALLATVEKGDEVIIPAPYWVSHHDVVVMAGGTPVVVQTEAQNGFKITPSELEQSITPNTRWLMINTPSNPTGAIYTAEELESLAAVLRQHPNVNVMTDDIYEHIRFDGAGFSTFAEACPDMKGRTLTVNGVSKAYAMTGWRIGFAGGPADLLKQMMKIQSHCTSNPSSISQAAAVAALNGTQDFLPEFAMAYQRRRDAIFAEVEKIDGLRCTLPAGAFYLFPNCGDLLGTKTPDGKEMKTDEDITMYLLDAASVAVVQGGAFGRSPHFRISLAKSEEELTVGIKRIAEAIARLS